MHHGDKVSRHGRFKLLAGTSDQTVIVHRGRIRLRLALSSRYSLRDVTRYHGEATDRKGRYEIAIKSANHQKSYKISDSLAFMIITQRIPDDVRTGSL